MPQTSLGALSNARFVFRNTAPRVGNTSYLTQERKQDMDIQENLKSQLQDRDRHLTDENVSLPCFFPFFPPRTLREDCSNVIELDA